MAEAADIRAYAKEFLANPTNVSEKKKVLAFLRRITPEGASFARKFAGELCDAKHISEEERCEVIEATLTRHDDAFNQLAEQQNREMGYKHHPWRATYDQFVSQLESAGRATIPELRSSFISAIKDRRLSPEQVLHRIYPLYGNTEDLRFWSGVLNNCTTYELQVVQHNWYILRRASKSFREQYGQYVPLLRLPLFPHGFAESDACFHDLNSCILNEAMMLQSSTPTGGRPKVTKTRFFAEPQEPSGAGVYAPVGQLPDGSYAVDIEPVQQNAVQTNGRVSTLEQSSETLQRMVDDLARRLAATEASLKAARRGPHPASTPQHGYRTGQDRAFQQGRSNGYGRSRGGGSTNGRHNGQRRYPVGSGTAPPEESDPLTTPENPSPKGF